MLKANDNLLISVIIPVYNASLFLIRSINSVLNNTYEHLEVILINDGSVDGSGEICDEFAKKDKRIKSFHQIGKGTASARNLGLELAQGSFIAFFDDDDIINTHFYEFMLKAICETTADIVVCELTREQENDEFLNSQYATSQLVDKHSFIKNTYEKDWTRNTAPWNKLYRKSCFNDIRFPAGKGYEDAYTTYKLLYNAKKIAYINCILYFWQKHEDSYSSKKDNASKLLFREEAIFEQIYYYKNFDYIDVSRAAKRFYLAQMRIMLWQLDHDYLNNEMTIKVRKKFLKKLKVYYRKYKGILSIEERLELFELIYPSIGGLFRKYILQYINEDKNGTKSIN